MLTRDDRTVEGAADHAVTGVRCSPFPGRIVGHPSQPEGSEAEVVESAVAIASREGVSGLDLLADRSSLDVPHLIAAVCRAVSKPVIVAGPIDRPEQIVSVAAAGFGSRRPSRQSASATQLRIAWADGSNSRAKSCCASRPARTRSTSPSRWSSTVRSSGRCSTQLPMRH